jgi:glutathione-regulated potassium-efflux system ancillary protein KefG
MKWRHGKTAFANGPPRARTTGMSKLLILFAHPAYQRSRANRALAQAARSEPAATFHDLYEAYPNFVIDVEREKTLLLESNVIVFQHPFYWYSCPALLKEWLDQTLELGFAYGPGGVALRGKKLLSVVTTGGDAGAYSREGRNHFRMEELLAPFEQTARLCGMEYLEPFILHNANQLAPNTLEQAAAAYGERLGALAENPNHHAAV